MYDGHYPIILGYVGLIIAILCVGWVVTRRIEDRRKRILWRSGVLAVVFAPGFFGAGHGGAIIPALLAAILVILHAEWSTPGLLLGVFFLFAIGPILVTWLVIYFLWRGCIRLVRTRSIER